ncbi:MAG: L-threonylcarbamoyladenylate synthase [Paracoccaceae bacterium]
MRKAETAIIGPDAAGLAECAAILRGGGLVAFPTETVYGLGADARNGRAVAAIFEAKERPKFNPLIVHLTDVDASRRFVEFNEPALALARAFWPGPLTLVLPRRPDTGLSDLVSAELPTLAVRAPGGETAQSLLRAFGGPVAAPSANPSGRISPTTADQVAAAMTGRIDAVLDGGACPVGLESTIIGFSGRSPVLLRPGGLPVEEIEACLGAPVGTDAGTEVSAPGQLSSHYAPSVALRLDARAAGDGEAWLGFGADPSPLPELSRNLSEAGDLREAAANLFSHLAYLDAQAAGRGVTRIAVAVIPETGLGCAINDRLRRAAAPRSGAAALR